MDFIGRQSELERLEFEYSKPRSFVVIYGRRRVGKTRLIREFIKDKHSVYLLGLKQPIENNLMDFTEEIGIKYDMPGLRFKDWYSLFRYVADKGKIVLVIDEFQYLPMKDPSFTSKMQKVVDEIFSKSEVMLILCGSHQGMMERDVLSYDSPLYGRRTSAIKLKPLSFRETRSFEKDMSFRQSVERYAITGGVPKYMELLPSVIDDSAIKEIFDPNGFFYREFNFLLQGEVSDIGKSRGLLKVIANGNRKMSDIAGAFEVKSNALSPYLETLMDLGIVKRDVPVTESNPERSRMGLYDISDNFLKFWFRFIAPFYSAIEIEDFRAATKHFRDHFIDSHVSFVFEDICREYVRNEMIDYPYVGSYWRKNVELDIVALDREGKRAFVGECKYRNEPVTMHVLNHLKEAVSSVNELRDYNITYGLFSVSGFDENLMNISDEDLILIDFSKN